MRLWPLTLIRRQHGEQREERQRILPLDEREQELLRRHHATREIREGSKETSDGR